MQRGYELHRVCFPAEVKDEVYRLYHEVTPKQRSAVYYVRQPEIDQDGQNSGCES